ncbi:DUF3108 domain-containing protein [Siansivirga zeaxanthinifaciens]|uniref:DUF3108 domain-containing protein n=1 Tax=Siansivirga zeaxanthinifaciens CC-SAMT-1 TaxID=1454006 RepID=A0A0C5WC85_9FLAO|nr:DUF3108 domain-containing protein [Siansivirga zeaxanthinifaciens]AJR03922.1 hypothetical protein AW14_10085 [Siansivirga zeaxanthinifaciens CC-SAMT-1]
MRLSIIFIFLLSLKLSAQNTAVNSGEKLVYTASYNMSGILNDLAQVTLETSTVKTSKATLLKLKCTAATYSKWDSFFKIRDLYETYVHPSTLTPFLHTRDINEGSYYKYMKYTFSHKTNTVKSLQKKKNNQVENKDVKINSGTKDIVSTIYSLRLIDFKNLSVGTSKNFTIIFDREEVKAKVTYLGKETINTAIGKKECFKLSVGSSKSNVLQGANNNLIWLTADQNKILVYGKFKIPVGNGELKIKSATGLKN